PHLTEPAVQNRRPIVNSLREDYMWAEHNLSAIQDNLHESTDKQVHWAPPSGPVLGPSGLSAAELYKRAIEGETMSFAYAGIDAPGCSVIMSVEAANVRLDGIGTCRKPACCWAIENDKECQRELKLHPSNIMELRGDLDDFWTDEIRRELTNMKAAGEDISLCDLVPLVQSGVAVNIKQQDLRGGDTRRPVTTDVHVAGISRRPFAAIGAHAGETSKGMTAMAAWAAVIWILNIKVLIVEQSDLFDGAILQKLFGSKYIWQSMILDGPDFGHPVRRKGFYGIGHRREKVGPAIASMANVMPVFYRELGKSFTFHDFTIVPAGSDEARSELDWARNRKKSLAYARPIQQLLAQPHPFEETLTDAEKKILNDYEQAYPPNMVCSLNQRPEHNRGMQSNGQVMYTITRNPSIDFNTSRKCRRWLFPTELMIAQGLPVLSWMTSPSGSANRIATSYSAGALMTRNRQSVKHQIGDTMQVMVIGSAITYAFLFTDWETPTLTL
ncbi:unnamed protein product, partial [Prorocentrum cordatum]